MASPGTSTPVCNCLLPSAAFSALQIQAQTGEGHLNMCHIKEVILTPSHLALVLDYEAGKCNMCLV